MQNKFKIILSSFFTIIFVTLSLCDESNPVVIHNPGTVTDIDGNVYNTLTIGNQVWMAENLRTTKYNDGSAIPLVTVKEEWKALTTPGYCYYNNTTNADSIKKYGALYNWYAVDKKKLAPTGWHVPTDAEWNTLKKYLIANGYNWDGTTTGNKIGKSMAAKTDWIEVGNLVAIGAIGNDLTKNNKSGFSAFPGANRTSNGHFAGIGNHSSWWSATEDDASTAYKHNLPCFGSDLMRLSLNKGYGNSVRLVRD